MIKPICISIQNKVHEKKKKLVKTEKVEREKEGMGHEI